MDQERLVNQSNFCMAVHLEKTDNIKTGLSRDINNDSFRCNLKLFFSFKKKKIIKTGLRTLEHLLVPFGTILLTIL